MKVLLINPAQDTRRTAGHYRRMLAVMPPISLAYLAASLEQAGVQVEVYDDALAGGDRAALEAALRASRADIVGLSVVTSMMPDVARVVNLIRTASPLSRVVLGNIHAHVHHAELLMAGVADIVVLGEGEVTLVELARCLASTRGALEDVAGIAFLRDGEVVRTAPRPLVEDLDALPFPAWHLFPVERYRLFNFARVREPGVLIQGSRGCPYGCNYCSLKIMGPARRARSARSIADEFEQLHERYSFVQPSFVDPIFPFSKEEGLALAGELIRRGLSRKQVWITETRTDLVDLELLQALREAGLRRIMFGFETGESSRLRSLGKAGGPARSHAAVHAARQAGLQIIGFFMLGIPGDTRRSMQATIQHALELDIDFAKFTVFVPYPGTPIHDELMSSGEIAEPTRWERYTSFPTRLVPPNYLPASLSTQDLIRYQRRAHLWFYLRPAMIARQLLSVRSLGPRDLWDGLRTIVTLGQESVAP